MFHRVYCSSELLFLFKVNHTLAMRYNEMKEMKVGLLASKKSNEYMAFHITWIVQGFCLSLIQCKFMGETGLS